MARILWAALASSLVLAMTRIETSGGTVSGLPPRLERYLTNDVRLTVAERTHLTEGAPVTKLLPVSDENKELAVFGAVWINAPIRRYVDGLEHIESFERGGGFRITRRIGVPPRAEDFADLHLPEEDLRDLQTCRVGACEVKLSQQSLERFRADVDWKAPNVRAAADALMQRLALEYSRRVPRWWQRAARGVSR